MITRRVSAVELIQGTIYHQKETTLQHFNKSIEKKDNSSTEWATGQLGNFYHQLRSLSTLAINLPPGKHTKTMDNHQSSWVNQLFWCPFSIVTNCYWIWFIPSNPIKNPIEHIQVSSFNPQKSTSLPPYHPPNARWGNTTGSGLREGGHQEHKDHLRSAALLRGHRGCTLYMFGLI